MTKAMGTDPATKHEIENMIYKRKFVINDKMINDFIQLVGPNDSSITKSFIRQTYNNFATRFHLTQIIHKILGNF